MDRWEEDLNVDTKADRSNEKGIYMSKSEIQAYRAVAERHFKTGKQVQKGKVDRRVINRWKY